MENFKYKAWDKENRIMVEVVSINFKSKKIYYGNYGNCVLYFEEAELMQFIGLQDKNNKDIYKGDIFHLGDENIKYTVVWHDTGFMGAENGSTSFVGLEHWKDSIEVIGNIYQNPELLEVRA